MVVADFETGGGGSKGVRAFVQGSDPGGVVVWSGDMGTDPQDGAGHDYFSTKGRATAQPEAAEDTG